MDGDRHAVLLDASVGLPTNLATRGAGRRGGQNRAWIGAVVLLSGLTGMLILELRLRRRGEPPAPEELPHVSAP
ncbi:hypothetical protein [Blastococcus sp. Marseille-P5729]|uniref:hypothetical protein n=1 Tax=Blastococcus sp. Marseille-P5729 TaxID=2086582 RepID=UPI001F28675E|nr:hypothetical protein [Blastococcus sp. Marseille-P5729]